MLSARSRSLSPMAAQLQGLEAIEALSYYGLHPDSALIVAEAHKLIPALLVANLGDKEVAVSILCCSPLFDRFDVVRL